MVVWLYGWCINWLVGWLVGWCINWLVGWLVGALVGWLVHWLVGIKKIQTHTEKVDRKGKRTGVVQWVNDQRVSV